jgi:hypothetical protein
MKYRRVAPQQRRSLAIERGEKSMLQTLAVVLVVLWILGMASSTTMGGLLHVLLAVAVTVILIRMLQGRRII